MNPRSVFIYGFSFAAVALCIWLIGMNPPTRAATEDIYDLIRSGQTHSEILKKLRSYGRSPDIQVKLKAAEFLLALGDGQNGSDICHAVLKNTELAPRFRILSATLLERHGILISFDLLGPLYHETQDSDVLRVMAMQGHPQATELILAQRTAGTAGGSYFFLAYTDKTGTASDHASRAITQAQGSEFTSLAIYHSLVMNDDRPLREVLTMLETEVPKPDDTFRDRRYDGEAFWLVINVKSGVIRDYLRRRITHMARDSATYALASLYAVQRDYAFIDRLIAAELTEDHVTSFHAGIFWRIVARRSVRNRNIANLVERHASPETKRAYFGLDSWFADDYWIGGRISYRPLAYRDRD